MKQPARRRKHETVSPGARLARRGLTQSLGRGRFEDRLHRLLEEFRFAPLREVLRRHPAASKGGSQSQHLTGFTSD
jgi:hypothetical protein